MEITVTREEVCNFLRKQFSSKWARVAGIRDFCFMNLLYYEEKTSPCVRLTPIDKDIQEFRYIVCGFKSILKCGFYAMQMYFTKHFLITFIRNFRTYNDSSYFPYKGI